MRGVRDESLGNVGFLENLVLKKKNVGNEVKEIGEQAELKGEENLGNLIQVPIGTGSQIIWIFSFFVSFVFVFNWDMVLLNFDFLL